MALYDRRGGEVRGYAGVEPVTGKTPICHVLSVDRAEHELGQEPSC